MPRALVIVNPLARTVEELGSTALNLLNALGFDVRSPQTLDKDGVVRAIREGASKVDLVVVAGGDGSLNVALQGLIGTGLPLGILPLGTANDLATSLGLPKELEAACRVIAQGVMRSIDVGWVNDVYFFNEMSIGMSPTVTRLLTKEGKAKLGVFASIYRTMQLWRKMLRFTVEIDCDEKHAVLQTAQLTIGNSRSFGGFVQSEEASLTDHKLDLYSIALPSWRAYFDGLHALLRRRYDEASSVVTMHGRTFRIRTRRPRPIEADGEVISMTPASVRVVPNAVKVFVPAQPVA